MADGTFSDYASTIKILVSSVIGGGVAVSGFLSRFQTKGGCKKSHAQHDALQEERQKTRDAKYEVLENKIENVQASQDRTHELVEKIADAVFVPRGS